MVKVKYDIRGSDPEKAAAAGQFTPPRPGVHPFKIIEVNAGFSKDKAGEPDQKRPRLEVVFSCLAPLYKGGQVWLYLPVKGSEAYEKVSEQKWDQLLQAVGHTDGKKNRAGELDTDKVLLNKVVKVRVKEGANQSGDYKAEFGSVFPFDGDESELELEGGEDDLLSDDEELGGEDEELIDEDEGEGEQDRLAELMAMEVKDLKGIAKELGIVLKGKTKATLAEAIVEKEGEAEAEGDGDGEDELLVEDDETKGDYLTKEQLQEMEPADIVKVAKDFDIVLEKGMKKKDVIPLILEAQGAGDDGDEELPF